MRVWEDSVEERTIANPGTGTISLGGPTVGSRPFSVIGDGNECDYRAQTSVPSTWEIGSGTYHSDTNSLSRDTIFINSLGTTAKVNLTGVCVVFLSFLSRRINTSTSSDALLPLTTGDLTADGGPVLVADPFGNCIGVPVE